MVVIESDRIELIALKEFFFIIPLRRNKKKKNKGGEKGRGRGKEKKMMINIFLFFFSPFISKIERKKVSQKVF
jgi:hypothetical protein